MKKTFIEKMAIGIIIFTVLSIIGCLLLYGIIGINLINNPEVFGEWFSRLTEGFNRE